MKLFMLDTDISSYLTVVARNQLADLVESFLERLSILDWTDSMAPHYARIRAALERLGKPIGNTDLMIAPPMPSPNGRPSSPTLVGIFPTRQDSKSRNGCSTNVRPF